MFHFMSPCFCSSVFLSVSHSHCFSLCSVSHDVLTLCHPAFVCLLCTTCVSSCFSVLVSLSLSLTLYFCPSSFFSQFLFSLFLSCSLCCALFCVSLLSDVSQLLRKSFENVNSHAFQSMRDWARLSCGFTSASLSTFATEHPMLLAHTHHI